MDDGGAEAEGAEGDGLVAGGDGAAADGAFCDDEPVSGVADWLGCDGLDAVLDGALDCEQPSIASPRPTNSPGIRIQLFLRSIPSSLLQRLSIFHDACGMRLSRLSSDVISIKATVMPLRACA